MSQRICGKLIYKTTPRYLSTFELCLPALRQTVEKLKDKLESVLLKIVESCFRSTW